MKLKMTGHDKNNTKMVTADELKKKFSASKGYFYSDIDWNDATDPIVVTITNTTYIDKALTGKDLEAVKKHEKQHFDDFKKLAADMKTSIEAALKAGRDPQMSARIDWLIFDRCQKSAAFHRKTAGYSVEICSQPSSKRPA